MYTIDVKKDNNTIINLRENDNNTGYIYLEITKGKNPVDLSGKNVRMAVVDKANKKGEIFEELEIESPQKGIVKIEITRDLTRKNGEFKCGLAVYKDSYLENTAYFILNVTKDIFTEIDFNIDDTDYTKLNTFLQLVDQRTKYLKNLIETDKEDLRGETGPTGPMGPTGQPGPIGPQGLQGLTGPAGPTGEQGVQGIKGEQGPRGLQGERGLTGPRGETGPIGPTGERGPIGPPGERGLTGPQGEKGKDGKDGKDGEQGPQGLQGLTGLTGPQGPQGERGLPFAIKKIYKSVSEMNLDFSGDEVQENEFVLVNTSNTEEEDNAKLFIKGSERYEFIVDMSGARGIQGPTGPRGLQGETGKQGPTGEIGPTGPRGLQGERGLTGPRGEQGLPGPKGEQGEPGKQGETGPRGERGLTGLQGLQGPAGKDGEQGPTGPAGPTGPQGPTGLAGPAGPMGPAGENAKIWVGTEEEYQVLEPKQSNTIYLIK